LTAKKCIFAKYNENNFNVRKTNCIFEANFKVPQINPNASKITGKICGYRVEEIEDKLMQKIRYLDKLIDELSKGKAIEKILRK
jgi:hypothetical protein